MQRRILTFATAIGTAGGFMLAACADEPTRPTSATLTEAPQSLGLSAEDRGQLQAAMVFARAHSMLALDKRDAADRVAAALAAVAERVERDDGVGVERAIVAARKAIDRYRAIAGPDDASIIDLEAVSLSLDHAASLAGEAKAARSYAKSPTPTLEDR